MWKEKAIGLIGRDVILRNKILPRINARKPFVISGQPGIGKTSVLEWAFDKTKALNGEIIIPFFERLDEIDKATSANGNTTCGMIWGGKGLGKTNLVHWLVKQKLDSGEQVYIFDPKEAGMNTFDVRASVIGNDDDYASIENSMKSLLLSMRDQTVRFTVFIDEANIIKDNIKGFADLWRQLAQYGRQYGKTIWVIAQSKTAKSLGLGGAYDIMKCFDLFVEMRWDVKRDKRYVSVSGGADFCPEKLVQPIKYDGVASDPHPIKVDRGLPKKAWIIGELSYGNIIKQIAEQFGFSTHKLLLNDVERLIMQNSTGNYVFVDDMQKLSVKSITMLKSIRDKVTLYGAMRNEKQKEDLKQLFWGTEIIKIGFLGKADNLRLSGLAAVHYGCIVSVNQIAIAAHGVPGRIQSFCATGEIPREDTRMKSEEIDISPVILIFLLALVLMRYIGRATSATDLVMVGGIAMVVMIVLRGMISSGRSK